jgi:fatty-acyl-CoA synthase
MPSNVTEIRSSGVRLPVTASQAYGYPLLVHQLFAHLQNSPTGAEIVQAGGPRLSYHDFDERVRRLMAALLALGVRPGEVIAVADWDSHRYLECYFAVPMLGCVLQTVNVRLAPDQIAGTLADTGAAMLLLHTDFAGLIAPIKAAAPSIRQIIVVAGPELSVCEAFPKLDVLMGRASPVTDIPEFDENAIATTFHTTGTTGAPKAVRFTHRQLVLHCLAGAASFANQPDGESFRRSDVYMPLTPMFHVHAWGLPYVATLLGVKQVYPGRYDPATILTLKNDEAVTFSHCVPTVLRMLLDHPAIEAARGWKMVIGGSALPRKLMAEARAAGITAFGGYGMSETGPLVAVSRSNPEGTADLSLAGVPAILVQARAVDSTMKDIPRDGIETGELIVRAPWLTTGYEGRAEASEELWRGGWLHTQDLASIEPDGRIRIQDRLKDLIKTGGEWLSPGVIEAELSTFPGMNEVAVVARPDDHWGERPVAIYTSATALDADEIRKHLRSAVERGRLAPYAIPDAYIHVPDLPRTSVGKLDRKALVQVVRATMP